MRAASSVLIPAASAHDETGWPDPSRAASRVGGTTSASSGGLDLGRHVVARRQDLRPTAGEVLREQVAQLRDRLLAPRRHVGPGPAQQPPQRLGGQPAPDVGARRRGPALRHAAPLVAAPLLRRATLPRGGHAPDRPSPTPAAGPAPHSSASRPTRRLAASAASRPASHPAALPTENRFVVSRGKSCVVVRSTTSPRAASTGSNASPAAATASCCAVAPASRSRSPIRVA